MFRSEIKINYGKLDDLVEQIMVYHQALTTMKDCVEEIWKQMEGNSGRAFESLEERKDAILELIAGCLEEVTDLAELLGGYSQEMQEIMSPSCKYQMMVVDRYDIWANMESIFAACGRIRCIPYEAVPDWLGDAYTMFPDEEERVQEEQNYEILECIREDIRNCYETELAGYMEELEELYRKHVVEYEKKDDEYAWKAKEKYYKYGDWPERFLNEMGTVGESIESITTGALDEATWVIDSCGEQLWDAGTFQASGVTCLVCRAGDLEEPKWAKENVEGTLKGAWKLLEDPFCVLESLAQEVTDTYEKEGLAYCVGCGIGAYAGMKGISAGVKSLKGIDRKGSKYSNLDDGLNFSNKALEHMGEGGRQVPIQTLQDAIRSGEALPDPRGSSAIMYYTSMYKNGKMYNLEVLHDKTINTVFHFEYARKAMGNLPAIK